MKTKLLFDPGEFEHPTDEQLAMYADGKFDSWKLVVIREHLLICDRCRLIIVGVMEIRAQEN